MIFNRLTAFVCSLLLAFCLVGAGFAVCCLPITTQMLARAASGTENPDTPFTEDELVQAALETRAYTVGDHSLQRLYETLWSINAAHPEGLNAAQEAAFAAADQEAPSELSLDQLQEGLAPLSDIRILGSDAISHLDDVYNVARKADLSLIIGAALLIGGLIFLGIRRARRCLAATLCWGGAIVLCLFAAVALWALVDFNGFFSALHGVFFSQGNWEFPYDSLLITMYPIAFWIGMGAIWLLVTVILSGLSLFLGLKLRK